MRCPSASEWRCEVWCTQGRKSFTNELGVGRGNPVQELVACIQQTDLLLAQLDNIRQTVRFAHFLKISLVQHIFTRVRAASLFAQKAFRDAEFPQTAPNPRFAGNSMTGSEALSGTNSEKRGVPSRTGGGREFWKCSGSLKCLEL